MSAEFLTFISCHWESSQLCWYCWIYAIEEKKTHVALTLVYSIHTGL